MLIPGFDGCYSKYSNICERVKIPAVAIQPGLEYVHEDVAEMGLRLAQVCTKTEIVTTMCTYIN